MNNVDNRPDLVIGAISGYNYDKIEPWVVSLEKSGFSGQKAMIVYSSDQKTMDKLKEKGFIVFGVNGTPNNHIVVDRFLRLWQVLSLDDNYKKYKRIITTDVKDVIFQSDPSKWLDSNLQWPNRINVGSECIEYQHEPWGNQNMIDSFPDVYEQMKSKTIYNCGTIAGYTDTMKDLFLNIYLLSKDNPRIHNADQAALNVLLSLEPYANIAQLNKQESGWAVQLGTTNDPTKIKEFLPYLKEDMPWLDQNDTFILKNGTPYCLVHQYDRVPELKELIENKYREV